MTHDPTAPQDPFADVPLFRELQRVLAAGTGPVNWELARQVGIATVLGAGPDPEPTDEDRTGFQEAVRVAELAVADVTGLPSPPEATRVRSVRRAEWIAANVEGLKGLFEPTATRLAKALAEQGPEVPEEGAPMLEAVMGRVAPLLMGAQVGVVLGYLGQRVLGQYEVPLPRADGPGLLFVVPNIAAFEKDWSLPPLEFRQWVALHETTHAFGVGRPWVPEHVQALVRDLAEHLSFDLSGIEERLAGLDLSDPQALTEAFGTPEALIGDMDEEQRLRLRRVQAFMAAAEGHAEHVMRIVGRKILGEYERISEAMRRRHEDRGDEDRAVEQLLGIGLKLEQYRLGGAFCDTVAELTDEKTLSRMWDGPDALPSMPELEEPRLWLARMA